MNDRNPTWYAEITFYDDGTYRQTNGHSFEKWLAEHDAKVRAEAYQRILDAANVDERSSVILAVVKGIARDGIREASDADRIEREAGLK